MSTVCQTCGVKTSGGSYCFSHRPYMVTPLKDGSFYVDRNGQRTRVWYEPPACCANLKPSFESDEVKAATAAHAEAVQGYRLATTGPERAEAALQMAATLNVFTKAVEEHAMLVGAQAERELWETGEDQRIRRELVTALETIEQLRVVAAAPALVTPVEHARGCPAIADDDGDFEFLADAGQCACGADEQNQERRLAPTVVVELGKAIAARDRALADTTRAEAERDQARRACHELAAKVADGRVTVQAFLDVWGSAPASALAERAVDLIAGLRALVDGTPSQDEACPLCEGRGRLVPPTLEQTRANMPPVIHLGQAWVTRVTSEPDTK